jgi:prolipoprotein diacylglyceryltransferase
MLLSIPSPSTGVVHLGPLAIRMYGLMLLLGIAACIWLTGVRWVRRGGDWDLVFRVAVWGVGFGIVGARLYHVIDEWAFYAERPLQIVLPPYSGLALYGGVAGGIVGVILWVIVSALFAFYVANFASYNKTYGSLGGVIAFLVWLWISNLAILLGAEFDAEVARGRQIEAGQPASREPILPPRDTTKIDEMSD